MSRFETIQCVRHSASDMFDLVADVECYPEFVPLCSGLTVLKREEHDDHILLICKMKVAYKIISEVFRCQVTLKKDSSEIHVKYLDGPFRRLDNIWRFEELEPDLCNVRFFIEYEFRSRPFQLVAGAVFDKAFHKFSEAFEARADQVYGVRNPTV